MPPKHLRTLKFTQINLEEACALWQAFGKNHILSYSCHLPLPWLLEKDGKRVCLLMLASLSNFESANTKKSPYLITRLKTLPLLNDISTSTGFTITTIIHWSHPIWGSLRCLQFIPFQLAVWAIVLKFSHDLGQLGISQPTAFFCDIFPMITWLILLCSPSPYLNSCGKNLVSFLNTDLNPPNKQTKSHGFSEMFNAITYYNCHFIQCGNPDMETWGNLA